MANKVFSDARGTNTPASGMICYSSAHKAFYSGWIDSVGGIWICKYDKTYLMWQGQKIATLVADLHDCPYVLEMSANGTNPGRILAVYAEHAGAQYSRLSTTSGDIRAWTSPVEVTTSSVAATFDYLYQANDTAHTVFLIYSQGTTAGNYTWGYKTSTNGTSWSGYVPILIPGAQTPIVRSAQDPANPNVIHWIICPDLYGVQYHAYMVVQSDASVKWYKSDGTEITSTLGSGWTGYTNFTQVTSEVTTSYDVQVYSGNPAFIYEIYTASGSDSTALITYKLAKWTGSAWNLEVITRADSSGTSESPSYAGPDYRALEAVTYGPGCILDPVDINTCYLSIAFGSSYSPALPSVANAGSLTDSRLEKWVKSGTWAKSADISGSTGTLNSARAVFPGYSPSQILYNSGSETNFFTYLTDAWTSPTLRINSSKPTTPVWTSAAAPLNVNAYYLAHENTGNILHDIAGTYSGSANGTLTWTTDGTYGPVVSGFSVDNYNRVDSLAAAMSPGTTWNPMWFAVLFKNSDSTSASRAVLGFSNTGSTSGFMVFYFNYGGTANSTGVWLRNDANSADHFIGNTSTKASDGNWHVFMFTVESTSSVHAWLDGVQLDFQNPGLTQTTWSLGSIGGVYTSSNVNPCVCTIGAVLFGFGAGITIPDASYVYKDLISGQFGGTRVASATTATLSGPSSGNVGVASTNFTITLDTTYPVSVSCPITSSVGGDTITSSPVEIAAGQTTGTFTVTPSTEGARNIILGQPSESLIIVGSPISYEGLAATVVGGVAMMMDF